VQGYGTVRFSNEEAAQRAVAKFDNMEWDGRSLKVFVDRYA
jgi:RNA recognition motif-containing protein